MRNKLFSVLALALILALPMRAHALGNPVAVLQSSATEGSHVFKTSWGSLLSLQVAIGTTAGYAMVFNSATVPADGSVTPYLCFYMPASTNLSVSFPYPAAFTVGLSAAFSTTGCTTKTVSTTAFFSAQVQ